MNTIDHIQSFDLLLALVAEVIQDSLFFSGP